MNTHDRALKHGATIVDELNPDITEIIFTPEQLTALIEDVQPKWTSVKDGFPSKTKQVEVVFYAKPFEWWTGIFTPKGIFGYEENTFEYHQHYGDDKYHKVENVIFWMPLPEPPKE